MRTSEMSQTSAWGIRLMRASVAAACLVGLLVGAQASAATPPPFDLLPLGSPPATIPYGITNRVFYQGVGYPIPVASDNVIVRVQPYHGNVLVSLFNRGSADYIGPVGQIGPTSAWRILGGGVNLPADATLAGQLLRVPAGTGRVEVYDTSTGRVVATLPAPAGDVSNTGVRTVGSKALVAYQGQFSGVPHRMVLWDPANGSTTALAGTAYSVAQRRSPGWLWRKVSAGCYARVPLATPAAAGVQVCQDLYDAGQFQPPLLSFDGSIAIAVRSGRLVAVEVATGRVLSTGTMGPIVANGSHSVNGAQWETTDTYIASAAWDGQTALVRCRVSDGRCERVVRSYRAITVGW